MLKHNAFLINFQYIYIIYIFYNDVIAIVIENDRRLLR